MEMATERGVESKHDRIWALIDKYLRENKLKMEVKPDPKVGCIPGDRDCKNGECKHGTPFLIFIRPMQEGGFMSAAQKFTARKSGWTYGSKYRMWPAKDDDLSGLSYPELCALGIKRLAEIKSWPTLPDNVFDDAMEANPKARPLPSWCEERAKQSDQLTKVLTSKAYRELDGLTAALEKLM